MRALFAAALLTSAMVCLGREAIEELSPAQMSITLRGAGPEVLVSLGKAEVVWRWRREKATVSITILPSRGLD